MPKSTLARPRTGRPALSYAELTSRNSGFISADLQHSIRSTRLLIAGCGLGGVIAEVAVRTGFTQLCLVDGDRVESHNLNRQIFHAQDIGQFKVDGLASRLRAINPEVSVKAVPLMLDGHNAADLVATADLVVDSIDFRDPAAIGELHQHARRQGKPVLAPLAVGWGGAAFVFRPDGVSLADLLDLAGPEPVDVPTYVEAFARLMNRYAAAFPGYALRVLQRVLEEKEICPFSQLGPGTYAAASLSVLLAVRMLAKESVPSAPEMILVDPLGHPVTCNPAARQKECAAA